MTTYVVYKKSSREIVRIDSTGGQGTGPDRDISLYSSNPAFIAEHAVWTVPLEFHKRLRMDVLHKIGTNATLLMSGTEVLGIKVTDRPSLEARAKRIRKQETLAAAISQHKEKVAVERFLADNPLSDDTDARAIVAECDALCTQAMDEWERVHAGGPVDLTPILHAKAGEEIRTND